MSIKVPFEMVRVATCPHCSQHQMDVDYLERGTSGNHICRICGSNWKITFPEFSGAPGVQEVNQLEFAHRPLEYVPGYVLLQSRRPYRDDGLHWVIVEEMHYGLGGPNYFEEKYKTTDASQLFKVPAVLEPEGGEMDAVYRFVAFISNDEIRAKFHWTWQQFAEDSPHLTSVQWKQLFPQIGY